MLMMACGISCGRLEKNVALGALYRLLNVELDPSLYEELAISVYGPVPLVSLHGRVNAEDYMNMLEEHFIPYSDHSLPVIYMYVQDNMYMYNSANSIKKNLYGTKYRL